MPAADIAWPTDADEARWEQYPGLAPTEDEREQSRRLPLVARVADSDIDAMRDSLLLTPGAPILDRAQIAAVIVAARNA